MAEITASLVKELREKTGAGMMDCKKALAETAGEIEAAVDWLRKKGLAAAAKKSGRIAAEGLVGLWVEGNQAAVVEVNTETDFVARNDAFRDFVTTVAHLAATSADDVDALGATSYPGTENTVAGQLTNLIATIGENMNLRRMKRFTVEKGVLGAYLHSKQTDHLGRIGVLVVLETEASGPAVEDLGRKLAMHVAAAAPLSVDRDGLDTSVLDRERAVLVEQARASGKPEAIIEKMVQGRLTKFYEEVCLLDQIYVVDGESRVRAIVDAVAKEAGTPIKVRDFVRMALGEGLEKRSEDFASEVAKAVG